MKRTPLKRTIGTLKKKPLNRTGSLKKKPVSKETIKERQDLRQQDQAFYERIWANRPHFCQVCRSWLGNIINKMFFDHLLEKSKYPQFRHREENIALVCPTCHGCKTNGHPKTKHVLLIEEAREKLLS